MNRLKILWQLFAAFFKVGCFTFGGGLAMLPLIQREVVDNKKWMDENEIVDVFAISQSVPGVIAINSSVFVGKKAGGVPGAVAAALGVILPAFLSILLVITGLSFIRDYPVVNRIFAGIRAASAALILLSAIKLGRSAVKGKWGVVIAAAAFLLIVVFHVSAVWTVVLGAFFGFIMSRFKEGKKDV